MLAFFAPLRIFSMSLANMLQPEISRLAAAGDEQGWRRVRATWTRRAVMLALVYGNICIAALPHLHLRSLEHQPVMFVAALAWPLYATVLAYLAPRILLETRMRFREIAAITTICAIISLAVTALLLHVAAPAYSLIGAVLGEGVAAALTWRLAAQPLAAAAAMRKSRGWPAPAAEANYEAETLLERRRDRDFGRRTDRSQMRAPAKPRAARVRPFAPTTSNRSPICSCSAFAPAARGRAGAPRSPHA